MHCEGRGRRECHDEQRIAVGGAFEGGQKRDNGLPFTSANVGVGYAHCSCWVNTSNFGNTVPTGYVPPNQDYFHIERQRTDGVGVYSCDNTNFNNTTDMMVAGSYIV